MNLVTPTISRVAYGLVVIALALVTLPVAVRRARPRRRQRRLVGDPDAARRATPTPAQLLRARGPAGSDDQGQRADQELHREADHLQALRRRRLQHRGRSGFFALKGLDEPQIDVGGWIRMPIRKLTVAATDPGRRPVHHQDPRERHARGPCRRCRRPEHRDRGRPRTPVRSRSGSSAPSVPGSTCGSPARSTPRRRASADVRLEHDRGWLPWTGSGKGTVTYTVREHRQHSGSPLRARVELTGLFGRDIDKATAGALVDLLPGQTVTMTQAVERHRHPRPGHHLGDLGGGGGDQRQASPSSTWIVPWLLLALLLIVLAGGLWWWQRRRAEPRRGADAVEKAPRITVSAGQ